MSTVKTLTAYIKTKRFLLIRDDIEQCLIALRTQSVSKEILDAVKVTMLKNTDTVVNKPTMSQSNAKKRPPSSELGNPMHSNPSNDDTAHQKLCVFCPRKKVRTVSIDHDSIDTHHALLSSSRTAATTATRTATATSLVHSMILYTEQNHHSLWNHQLNHHTIPK